MLGATEAQRITVDMLIDGIEDFRIAYGKVIYQDAATPEAVAAFAEKIKTPLVRGGGQVRTSWVHTLTQ